MVSSRYRLIKKPENVQEKFTKKLYCCASISYRDSWQTGYQKNKLVNFGPLTKKL